MLRIATKAGLTRTGPGQWATDGGPEHLRSECEGSLARLGVDRIDLFQLHRVDGAVPADDQFGTLKELRDEGKVAEVGLSEVSVEQIEAARRIVAVVSVQNQYNLGQRGADDVVDHCEQNGIGFIPWAPLASGKLSRPGGPLDRVATELGATVSPGVPGLAPAPFADHDPHPRDGLGGPPGGELRGRRSVPVRRSSTTS